MDDFDVSGGTQRDDTARDPDLPRNDDPIRGAQEQDDSSKATGGVTLPGGAKLEGSTDGDQWSGTLTIPFGGGPAKPIDTTPSPVNPDAPADPGSCIGDDGQSYPNGWVQFRDNQPVATCMNGIWVPAAAADAPQPGDYPMPSGVDTATG